MRITKVYTKVGDGGETLLIGGLKVSKSSPRVEAYGDVDELNSLLGVALAWVDDAEIRKLLLEIQNELFTLGADLASPLDVAVPRIEPAAATRLEKKIDALLEELPPLKEFILPGGRKDAAYLHLSRAVARRAERRVVQLAQTEPINPNTIVYMNRLSDFLFVVARVANLRAGNKETFVTFPKRKK